jgi:ubiquinol-cytochrome c reductase cytochrome c subunit
VSAAAARAAPDASIGGARMIKRLALVVPVAAAVAAGVITLLAAGGGPARAQGDALGRELFETQCAACHASDGSGVEGRGPSLEEEGRASVDFVLRTGRMPLAAPDIQARRRPTRYTEEEIVALVDHVGAIGTGPDTPIVDASAGDLATGARLYQLNCAACHVASGSGAAIGGGREAPDLMRSTATEIGQAIRIGPGAMPVFGSFTDQDLNDVAAYVLDLQARQTTAPDDFGGAGPVAEGLAAWLLALLPLIALTRWIGTPHEGRDAPVEPSEPAEGVVP